METTAKGLLLPRVAGALALRRSVFSDVAADPAAGFQAGLLIVVIGTIEATVDAAVHEVESLTTPTLMLGVIAAMIGWLIWSVILWAVARRGFGYEVDLPSAVRVVAFAHAPTLIYGLGAVDLLTPWVGLVFAVTVFWFAAALIVAIQGWLDVALRRAALVFLAALGVRIFIEEVVPWTFRMVPLGN